MITFASAKKIVYTTIIIYIILIGYTIINKYISITRLIDASLMGITLAIVNMIFEIFLKDGIKKRLHKIKRHAKRLRK